MRLNDFVELKCFANLHAQCAHRNLLNKILTDRPTSFSRTSRFKPSLPAGRSAEQVHDPGAGRRFDRAAIRHSTVGITSRLLVIRPESMPSAESTAATQLMLPQEP